MKPSLAIKFRALQEYHHWDCDRKSCPCENYSISDDKKAEEVEFTNEQLLLATLDYLDEQHEKKTKEDA